MKISYNWLQQYININLDPDQIAAILTDIGLEVSGIEKYESVKGGLKGIVVGEVITKVKHPDADKLSITTVDIGQENLLNIVCGAPNVEKGQKVVVATVGTTLYNGDESFVIKRAKIRGVESEGMICAEDEIGLGTSHDGIMVLDKNAKIGTKASEYFKIDEDFIFDVDLTPNRIDGASHYGVARDLTAYIRQSEDISLTRPSTDQFNIDNRNLRIDVIVENAEACPRYSGITITGVTVKESPSWLKNRLRSIGLKPINNIVDVSNYILHAYGQPLHAFDADKIEGKKVIVKTMPDKTKFITLDEIERELSDKDLMICNTKDAMCIAGVFGGFKSGVTNKTKNIFIESAHFNPVWVRKTARRHGLSTDSSFRFERGADPNITIYALQIATILIKEVAGGTVSSDIVDIYPTPIKNHMVELLFSNIERLIGNYIEKETIKNILKSLEIKIVAEKDIGLLLEIPTYRVDVTREADVIEEILRIYGYNNIDISTKVNSSIQYTPKPNKNRLTNIISNMLSYSGFNEIMSNSLTKLEYYENSESYPSDSAVKIFNPLSKDLSLLRKTLVYGGLEAISYNINRKTSNLKLYEFGNCYNYNADIKTEEKLNKYSEEEHLALFITGKKNKLSWNSKEEATSFYLLKSYVENILKRLNIDIVNIEKRSTSNDIFEEAIYYSLNNKLIVNFGIINKKLRKQFEIEQDVFYADINWTILVKESTKFKVKYAPLSKYPEVKRDLALLLDKSIEFEQIKQLALNSDKKLIKDVSLFDYYTGENIDKNKKSYAINITLLDNDKTLTDKQIDKVMKNLIFNFEKEFNAKIR